VELLKAWTDPAQKHPKTIHHHVTEGSPRMAR
jgi:hypothetical protein